MKSGSWGQLTYYQDGVGNRTSDIFNDNTTTTTKTLGYPFNMIFPQKSGQG
jgi:hypothetical protein